MEKEYALVLAGGGTRGSYQVGAWKALKDLGIKVKAVMGTSIGSLNGALILQDDVDMLIELYQNLELKDMMEINEKVDTNVNLFDIRNLKPLIKEYRTQKGINNKPLRDTIEKYIDLKKIYKSKMDFGLVTYSVDNEAPLQLYKEQIPKDEFVDFLLASSCLPIFKNQKIGNFQFVDGAFYDNIPINMAIEKGYKNIIVIDINGTGFNRRLADKNIYLKVISPNEDLGGTMNFNKDRMNNNIALGYLDTMRSFNKMQGHIYYFYSSEFNKMLEVFNLQTIYGLENAAKIYGLNKYKPYKFEEFIEELIQRHNEAKEKYKQLQHLSEEKNIAKLKANVETMFKEKLGICFVTDVYLDKPMSKRFDYLRYFIQDYVDSVAALLELENYIK